MLGVPRVEPPVGSSSQVYSDRAGQLGGVGQDDDAEGLVALSRQERQCAGRRSVVLTGHGGTVAGRVAHRDPGHRDCRSARRAQGLIRPRTSTDMVAIRNSS